MKPHPDVRDYVTASIELAETVAANKRNEQLLGALYAKPLPGQRATDREATDGGVEGRTGEAAGDVPACGLQARELSDVQPRVSADAAQAADQARGAEIVTEGMCCGVCGGCGVTE